MHALDFDKRPLIAAAAALLLTLVAALAAVSLPTLDFGSGGDAATASSASQAPAGQPAWVSDPLAPPSLLGR